MAQTRSFPLDEVVKQFHELEDPRLPVNLQHPLASVVAVAVLAVLAGAGGPTAIAAWALLKQDLLLRALDLPNGVPRKDVFRRVLSLLQPDAFRACFAAWLRALRAAAAEATGVDRPVLAVDGKTARRSHDRGKGLGALHAVTVWASEYGLALGQVACEEKSNEITAIPEVLRLVDLKGAIVTIDAMGTQKAIAEQIIDAEADYVLALKGNQETIHEAVKGYFDEQIAADLAGAKARLHQTTEAGHGRQETRTYLHMAAPPGLPGAEQWKGLKSLGMVVSECVRGGKEAVEVRYFLSSLPLGVRRFAHAVRSHWAVENSCHWSLDVTYREDESRIRQERLRDNFAWLNRFTLSLLKQHPGKQSVAMKRRCCAWSDDFMVEVLTGKRVSER